MKKTNDTVIGIRLEKGRLETCVMKDNQLMDARRYKPKNEEAELKQILKDLAKQEKQAEIAFVLPDEEVISIINEMPLIYEDELE